MSQTKYSKFSMADVIAVLTAVSFGYVCFLGVNFYTLGDKSKSITIATAITITLIAISLGLKRLKRTVRPSKNKFILEIILLVVFAVLISFFTNFPFSHYFFVSAQKNSIQATLNQSISQAEDIYNQYQTHVNSKDILYKSELHSAVLGKGNNPTEYKKLGFNDPITCGVSEAKQEIIIGNSLKMELLPANFNLMKSNDSAWLTKARIAVNDWKPISVVDVINSIDSNTNKSINELVAISEKSRLNKVINVRWTPTISSFKNVKVEFQNIGPAPMIATTFSIVSFLLMLLSYLSTPRSTKSKYGFRAIFTSKRKTTSEFDIEY